MTWLCGSFIKEKQCISPRKINALLMEIEFL